MPAVPAVLILTYIFLKPLLPEPHLWKIYLQLQQGVPLDGIGYADLALHLSAGILLAARVARLAAVKLGGGVPAQGGEAPSPQDD